MVDPMESFADKLKALGVQLGMKENAATHPGKVSHPIESVLSGREDETPFGHTFIFERHTSADDRQGQVPFGLRPDLSVLSAWRKNPNLAGIPIHRILYLDTETSGLAGGTGTFAFMVGVGYIDEEGFHLYQLFLRHPAEETALLASLTRIVQNFDVIVTFNGASFDIPLLNTRHTLNSIQSPFPERLHVDLLPLARRLWRNRLPSRRLGNLEIEILRLSRSEEEVPGWLVPEMYHDYILSGDARPLAGVFYHNEMDIRSLGALFLHCADLLTHPMAYIAEEGLDLVAIGRLFEELGQPQKALEFYNAGMNAGLPQDFYLQTLLRYAEIHRKVGEMQQACELWTKAANLDCAEACIHLAKYYEHQRREFHQALFWTERALRLTLVKNPIEKYSTELLTAPLQARLERLKKKIAGRSPSENVLHSE